MIWKKGDTGNIWSISGKSRKVFIRRKDGQTFALTPTKISASPLDVPTIKATVTTEEIVDLIREGRER
jgi:hypothetical protein